MRHVHVIGTSGSGKTTLARVLARRMGVPHVELDARHWEPNWTMAQRETLRERVSQALTSDGWTVDGNYSAVRDIIWSRADTVVWLDYSLPVVLSRVVSRTARRIVFRVELWNGNRERLSALFTRDSIIWWALSSYHRRRREYPALFQRPEYAHLRVIHLRSPREARAWLTSIPAAVATSPPS